MKGLRWKLFVKLGALLMSFCAISVINTKNVNADSEVIILDRLVNSVSIRDSISNSDTVYTSVNEKTQSPTINYFVPVSADYFRLSYLKFNLSNPVTLSQTKFVRLSLKFEVDQASALYDWSFVCPGSSGNYNVISCTVYNYDKEISSWNYSYIGNGQIGQETAYGSMTSFNVDIVIGYSSESDFSTNVINTSGPFLVSSTGTSSAQFLVLRLTYASVRNFRYEKSAAQAVDDLAEQEQKNREEDQQNLDNAQSSADNAGSDSSSDATSAGTTLLAGFSAFTSALTNASASDCKLKMDMGNLNLGDVDLCSLSIPAPLQALSSIILIAFCVPLSLATAKKLIGLFRSFQT